MLEAECWMSKLTMEIGITSICSVHFAPIKPPLILSSICFIVSVWLITLWFRVFPNMKTCSNYVNKLIQIAIVMEEKYLKRKHLLQQRK